MSTDDGLQDIDVSDTQLFDTPPTLTLLSEKISILAAEIGDVDNVAHGRLSVTPPVKKSKVDAERVGMLCTGLESLHLSTADCEGAAASSEAVPSQAAAEITDVALNEERRAPWMWHSMTRDGLVMAAGSHGSASVEGNSAKACTVHFWLET